MAEQEVLNTLSGVANESKEVREEAERRLSQYTLQPGYGGILCRIMSNGDIPVHLRQVGVPTDLPFTLKLAGIILKRFIREQWDEKCEKRQNRPVLTPEDKQEVKGRLPALLAQASVKVRTAAALAISSIAHWDWPDQWPDLLPNLLGCLGSDDMNLVCITLLYLISYRSTDPSPAYRCSLQVRTFRMLTFLL